MSEKKPSFLDVLFERVRNWMESENNRRDLSSLFDFVQEVALESFRNGLVAGKTKSTTYKSWRPREERALARKSR